ncbi:MAG: RNA pseudouridine synthase [Bacteroidota bacterium]
MEPNSSHPSKYRVIYEDNHLLVVDKASGVLVQGDKTGDTPLVELCKEYIKEKYEKPGAVFLGVVHRLDRPVSGVVVLARTSKALERMNALFRKRDVHKTYWAITKRRPREMKGKLVHYLEKDEKRNVTTAHDYPKEGAQKAELNYKVLGKLNDHWLIEVEPITGRPHQIRVQLASMGCPIRGDVKYGFPKPNTDGSIHLHAKNLVFEHPVKKEQMIFRAGVPRTDFWEQFLQFEDVKKNAKRLDRLH